MIMHIPITTIEMTVSARLPAAGAPVCGFARASARGRMCSRPSAKW